jgi:hypothetical protein
MAKAQAEYLEKTGHGTSIADVMQNATDRQAYRLDGIKATEDTRGIIVKDGKKILKN